MDDERERLRATFDGVADAYELARPSYPPALFDDLVGLTALAPGARVLEIGCGTGQATRPLLERGLSVVCVELGARLAARARARLSGWPFEIHVAPFELWEPTHGSFDLVLAATSWHWVDPAIRYAKAHRLLRENGHLAFFRADHAFPEGFDPFFGEIQDVYDAIGEPWDGAWPPPPPDAAPDDASEIAATGLFENIHVRRFVWDISMTADEYIALLGTFSSHIAMEPSKREHLFHEIRTRLARRADGRVRRHWQAILHVARSW